MIRMIYQVEEFLVDLNTQDKCSKLDKNVYFKASMLNSLTLTKFNSSFSFLT